MIYKFDKGETIKLQPGSTIPDDEQFDSIRPAHKIDLSKARRKEIRNFARNLAGMDNPEYGATAKNYQEGFVNLGLNKRKSKFFDRVFRDQLAKNLEHTNRVNRDQQVIQAAKEGNFDPEQFGEWLALKRDESPITQKLVMPLVTGAAFGPAMAVASLAGEATNLGTNAITSWDTWGKALASGRKGWSEAAELTNPGYIVTGPLANGGQRLTQGWKTVANSTKDLQNQAVTKIAKEVSKNINKNEFIPAQVKYYGPTMGKSYAAKTNPNLIDLDTWGRSEYDQLAKKYGYKDWREMILSDKGDYNEEYKQLIKDQIRRIQSDPQYSGKTIVVSNASLLKPNSGVTFANTPVIPERSIMAARNTARHPWESIEHGEEWWDSLQRKGTPLKIDNRFISDIEGNKAISFTPAPQKFVSTVHFDPRVKPLSRPISKVEKAGIIKSERPFYDQKVLDTAKLFAKEYGYPEPTTIEEIKNMYRRHNTFFRTINDLEQGSYHSKIYDSLPEWFKALNVEEKRKVLASKGYPIAYRTGIPSDKFLDQFVFVSPSLERNASYFEGNGGLHKTVKLQRPFSFRDPKRWYLDADWRPYPKEYLNDQYKGTEIWPIGHTEVGNASPASEIKIATDKLIPVDIAKPTDKGTLLGDYFVKRRNGDEFHNIPYDRYGQPIYRRIHPEYDIAPEYGLEYLEPERNLTREYPVFPELQDNYILKYLQSQGFKLPIKKQGGMLNNYD